MAMPSTTCNERVGAGTVTYPCSLDAGHTGPHYAIENRASVSARQRWNQAKDHEDSPLAQFQGPAQTTAERYTTNPSPLPQSPTILRQDAADARRMAEQAASIEVQRLASSMNKVDQRRRLTEDGLDIVFRGPNFTIKQMPDGRYMIENLDGTMGEALVLPTWIDVADDDNEPNVLLTAPTKQRDGDQDLPVANSMKDAQSQMAEDIMDRREIGIQRYGTALQPFNGRNTVLDAYEEALDLGVYLRTLLTMREASREMLIDQATQALIEAQGDKGSPAHGLLIRGARALATKVVDRLLDALTKG